MKVRSRRNVTLTIVGVVALAAPARATIDMTGRWILMGAESPANFVQTGTSLTETSSAGTRFGTIDSTTGAFGVADPAPCQPFIGPGQCGLGGTVAPDGLTLTGTFSCIAAGTLSCMVVLEGPVQGWFSPPTCGNGVLDPGEECDDGNTSPDFPQDCCDPGCRYVAQGTRCNVDGNFCNDPRTCDGAGACVPLECKLPAVAGAARLAANASSVRWKWAKGQATTLADFGNPVTTDDYTACLLDESGATPHAVALPDVIQAGVSWHAQGARGFVNRSPLGGGRRVILKPGIDGKAKIILNTGAAPLPLPLPFTVQLYGHGECWSATFDAGGVRTSTSSHFVGSSAP